MSDTTTTPADLARELIRRLDAHAANGDIVAFTRLAGHHARTIAEALLAAEADNADLRGKLLTAAERIAAQSELLSKRAAKSEAEARAADLEAAMGRAKNIVDTLVRVVGRGMNENLADDLDEWDSTLQAVLAKGKGATP